MFFFLFIWSEFCDNLMGMNAIKDTFLAYLVPQPLELASVYNFLVVIYAKTFAARLINKPKKY